MLTKYFGDNLRYHRKLKGWSSRKLADESGLAKSYVDYLESGQRVPSAATIRTLLNALELERTVLLYPLVTDYMIELDRLK